MISIPHIVISDQCKLKLESIKIHPREAFGDVVDKLLQEHEELKILNRDLENPSFEEAVKIAEETHKELNLMEEVETPKVKAKIARVEGYNSVEEMEKNQNNDLPEPKKEELKENEQ